MPPWRRLRASAALLGACAATLLHGSALAATAPPPFTVAGTTSTLAATSMLLTGFSYVGPVTVAGNDTLEFSATAATASALVLVQPCHSAGSVNLVSAEEAGTAALPGGFTIWATDLQYSDGSLHTWTPGTPPSVGALEPDGTTVTAVSATIVASSLPGLTLAWFRTFAAFCTPGSAQPAAAGSQSGPTAPQTPPASPTPSPVAIPSPSPLGEVTPAPPAPLPTPSGPMQR